MSVSTPVFWKLLQESRLLAPEQCGQLAAEFQTSQGAGDPNNVQSLAAWLIRRNVLSRYQTMILLAGRSGPFHYGDYKVYDRVDKGPQAGAFRAVHAPTGHPVLLQFLTGAISQDPNQWAAAAGHALAACSIVSPFVQRYYEAVDLQSFKFLVTEELRGASLDAQLQKGKLPPAEACRLVRMAALGLAAMHQAGRTHGDVRPANLFLESTAKDRPPTAKLRFDPHLPPGPINFAAADPSSKLAALADFIAPELTQPGRAPDPLSDVYALGCSLYTLLTGTPPFAGGDVQQKLARHASEPIRPLESFGIGPPLAQIVPYMMAKNPAVRYQAAAIVAEQLAPLVDPAQLVMPPVAPPPTQVNFEHYVLQRRQQMAAQVAPPSPMAAAPAVNLNFGAPSSGPTGNEPIVRVASSAKKSSSATLQQYARAKRRKQIQAVIGGVLCLVLMVVAGVVTYKFIGQTIEPGRAVAGGGQANPGVTPTSGVANLPPERTQQGTAGGPAPPGGAQGGAKKGSSGGSGSDPDAKQLVVPDDGELLWASPTKGEPVAFRMVPPEGQVFMIVRPSELLASAEGAKVLEALGPNLAAQRTAWEQAAGMKLEEIEQMIITLHNNDAQFPRTSLVVKTKEPISRDELLAKWGNPSPTQDGDATYFAGPQWAYYVSESPEDERTFLMGAATDVSAVAKAKGAPPQLFRDMERLRRSIDGQRHFSVLFFPPFFFNDDGQPIFQGERQKVRAPLEWLLGDSLAAGLVSAHVDETFYFEMRMLGSLDKERYQLAEELRTRLQQVPTSLVDYFVTLTPPPYWKKLSFRYPQMVTTLHDNMRIGVESDQAVVNSVLPAAAAHNLVLGGELLIATTPGGAVASVGPAAAPAGPKTIEEVLNLKTSFAFDATSLEFAMSDLAAEVQDLAKGTPFGKGGANEFNIRIIGGDLESDGITRNQTVRDFKQDNKTIAEILTALAMKANPVTTVKEPSEVDQKLLWVVAADPEAPTRQTVLITTRTRAAQNKHKLPAVFQPK